MSQVNKFNFEKYDKGGTNASAGDNKLTGEEVENAKNDGWTVWDDFCSEDVSLVEYIENDDKTQQQAEIALKTQLNSRKSESYKKYEKRVNELLAKILLDKYGIVLREEDQYGLTHFSEFHFDKRYKDALEEAKTQAKQEYRLSNKAFESFITDKPNIEYPLGFPDNRGTGDESNQDIILPFKPYPIGGIGRYTPIYEFPTDNSPPSDDISHDEEPEVPHKPSAPQAPSQPVSPPKASTPPASNSQNAPGEV